MRRWHDVSPRTIAAAAIAAWLGGWAGTGQAQQCDLYKRLATVHDGVHVNDQAAGTDVCGRVWLNGVIRQSVADDAHCAIATAPYGLTFELGSSPIPDAQGFMATHWSDGQTVSSAGTSTFNLAASPGSAGFFRTLADPDANGYSVYVGPVPDPPAVINVSGTAIWLLDHGFRSDQVVVVNGSSNDCLVMVSRRNQDAQFPQNLDIGLWFSAGIQSPNVPVIFVTDGEIRAEHLTNLTGAAAYSVIPYVSLFANHVVLGGPAAPNSMSLSHDPASAYDRPGGLIDALCLHGLLPNTEGPPVRATVSTWGRLQTLYR
jgi:hypothetical protein